MKLHHAVGLIGIGFLFAASQSKVPDYVGWWMIGGLLFLALSFMIFATRR